MRLPNGSSTYHWGTARDVLDAPGRVPRGVEAGTGLLDAGDDQGRVGLLCRTEVLLDPHVHPERPPLEPAATAPLELCGLGDPGDAEDVLVESNRPVLGADRHGQLHMVERLHTERVTHGARLLRGRHRPAAQ